MCLVGILFLIWLEFRSARVTALVEEMMDYRPDMDATGHARAFQRFARSEAARSTPGHGLGLALVRAVAIAHGGTAELAPVSPGFAVTLNLPPH